MNAKELMIGDLVHVRAPYFKKNKAYRVVEVREHGYNGEATANIELPDEDEEASMSGEFLFGIPLTPEILEKNGFKYDGSGQRSMMLMTPHGESGTRWNIYVGLKHKTIDVFSAPPVEKSPGWRKHNKVYLEVCGCYVHELQHALRLCGIDKTIEL